MSEKTPKNAPALTGVRSRPQADLDIYDPAPSQMRALDEAMMEADVARRRLQDAVEAISEGFALWDADDRLVLCNGRYHDFWRGLGGKVQPGVAYETLLREVSRLGLIKQANDDQEAWLDEFMERHRKPEQAPHIHEFVDGRTVQVSHTHTADGGIVTVISDVSALLEVEEARRVRAVADGAALLASTVTNIAQGVAVFDAQNRLVTWNRRACELLNLPYYAVRRGMRVREVIQLLNRHRARFEPEVKNDIADWIMRRRPRAPIQIDVFYPGATVIEAAFRAMPDSGFVATFADKTAEREAKRTLEHHGEELAAEVRARTRELVEVNLQMQREVRQRREAAEALEQARAAAVAANQSKTRFLAAASHDLLQPMSAAHLYLSALEDERDGLSDAAQRNLKGLSGALHSVEGLLSALLEISKLDSGGITADVRDVPLGPLLDDLGHAASGVAAEKGLKFACVATTAWAKTDPMLLRRILQNLITNAVKYTQVGGVVVGVRRDGDGLRIEVWDNGPGIPEADQAAIFEEFRRGSSQDTGDVPGVGLGLAIVQRTADVLGHEVTLISRPGIGTRFAVRLPRGERPAGGPVSDPANAPGAGEARHVDWSRRLVLLLENDREIARGMQALFERWNCPLLTAPSYEEMAERLEDEEAAPDFLVADLDLDSAVNGLMAVQRLRETFPDLPAALVTADRSAEIGAQAEALGVERFFKPARPAELRAYIEHCWRMAEAE